MTKYMTPEVLLDQVHIRLTRLEDQLAGDMYVDGKTTVEHMQKRIEYAWEEVLSILKKIEKEQVK